MKGVFQEFVAFIYVNVLFESSGQSGHTLFCHNVNLIFAILLFISQVLVNFGKFLFQRIINAVPSQNI